MKKRLISMLLALSMVIGYVLPAGGVTALAATGTSSVGLVPADNSQADTETAYLINDAGIHDLDTKLPDTAAIVAGESGDTHALKGYFTVADPELVITEAMTQGNDFTIATRVYVPADLLSSSTGTYEGKSKYNTIASLGDSTFGLRIRTVKSSGESYVEVFIGDGSEWYMITPNALDASFGDSWHDIAATYSGTTLTLIVDGVVVGQLTDVTNSIVNSGIAFSVGFDPTKSRYNQDMLYEQVAVYNEALTVDELKADHAAADENVLLWLDFEEDAADESNVPNNINDASVNDLDTPLPDTATIVAGESVDSHALKGYFTVKDPKLVITEAMTQGNSFTVAARVYVPAELLSGSTGTFESDGYKHNVIASLGDSTFALRIRSTKGKDDANRVQTFVGNGSKWYQIQGDNMDASFGDQWHDFAVTYTGTTLTLIVDGVVVAESTSATSSIVNSGIAFCVGCDPTKSR